MTLAKSTAVLTYRPRRVPLPRQTGSYAAGQAALLGDELLAKHDLEGAESAFRIALRADPDNPRLVVGLADVLLVAEQRAAAREHYQRAVVLAPGLACAHNGLGLTAPDLDAAEASFRMAVEFDPNEVVYRANLGWALYELGVRGEAVATFMQCLEERPADLELAQALASILAGDEHYREAEFCLRAALEHVDDKPDPDDEAWLMYRLRAFDQAEKVFRRRRRFDFDTAAAFAMHGRMALAANLPRLAVLSLKRAVALSPRSEQFNRDLATALERSGDSFVADAARTRAGQMRRAKRRTTDHLAEWAEAQLAPR